LNLRVKLKMPIYAYRCEACGFEKDVLQKLSDSPLTDCPSCGQAEFKKQVTAAGFQLKGSGWYVTDFKGGSSAKPGASASSAPAPSSPAAAPSSPAPSADAT
jgi:putative FmdB family regulatory protein